MGWDFKTAGDLELIDLAGTGIVHCNVINHAIILRIILASNQALRIQVKLNINQIFLLFFYFILVWKSNRRGNYIFFKFNFKWS